MLSTPGNANDSDAKKQSKSQVSQTNPNSTDKYPDYIHNKAKATSGISIVGYFTPERP